MEKQDPAPAVLTDLDNSTLAADIEGSLKDALAAERPAMKNYHIRRALQYYDLYLHDSQ